MSEQMQQRPYYEAEPKKETSGLAIGAFVAALLLPAVGLVMGIIARKQDKEAGRPTGLATAAIWIGAVFTLVGLIAMGAIVAAIATAPAIPAGY